MSDLSHLDPLSAWRAHWTTAVAVHLVGALTPLLPGDYELVSAGLHITLIRRSGSGPGTTVVSTEVPVRPAERDPQASVAYALGDLQDLVIGHLHQPWPADDTGRGLYPWAEQDGDRVGVGFADTDGNNVLPLPPFPLPPEPSGIHAAG